jgi:hypothetical protein
LLSSIGRVLLFTLFAATGPAILWQKQGGLPVVKRCLFCGKYFTPDHRVKQRQKACFDPGCRKKRKKAAQDAWVQRNPDYFDDLYKTYVKPWRKRTMIKDEIPHGKPLQRLILLIPDGAAEMIKDEIRLKRIGRRTFAPHGYG